MEYYNLKLEYKNNYRDSHYTDSLALILSEAKNINKELSFTIIKKHIAEQDSPIKFLNMLKKEE